MEIILEYSSLCIVFAVRRGVFDTVGKIERFFSSSCIPGDKGWKRIYFVFFFYKKKSCIFRQNIYTKKFIADDIGINANCHIGNHFRFSNFISRLCRFENRNCTFGVYAKYFIHVNSSFF